MGLPNSLNKTKLKTLQCGTCGTWHAIPDVMYNAYLAEGGFWHCPNGHQRGFSEGSVSKQLEKEIKRRKWADDNVARLQRNVNTANRSVAALKGVNTRMKNRAKAGVCPCCNRTFKQLAAHMKNKHPDYQSGEKDE